MKKTSNSHLSQRILLALNNESASSIAALARKLELLRPSVSRTVNSLQDVGLVTRQGRTILLTEEGQEEAQRLKAEIPVKVKKSTDLATRILVQAAEQQKQLEFLSNNSGMQATLDAITGISRQAALPNMQATLDAITGISRQATFPNMQAALNISPNIRVIQEIVNGPSMQLQREVINSVKISNQLAGVIASISQVQQINLSFLQIQPLFASEHLFVENNLFIGRMIADLTAIASVDIKLESLLGQTRFLAFEAAKAYDAHFRTANDVLVGKIDKENTLGKNLKMELVVPTTTTSSLISSTRNVIKYQSNSKTEDSISSTEVQIHSQQYFAMSSMLEYYLSPLGIRFVSKWHGAWQTLSSQSEDRYSQATHSGRELLMQILAHLAPDELFTEEEIARNNGKPPTRRMRIKRILGSGSKAEWVDKTAAALDSLYDVLAAESHNRDDGYRDDDTAAGELIVLGGLLLTLLSKRNNSAP